MDELVEWLRGVLDDIEATAKAAAHAAGHTTGNSDRWEHLASYDAPEGHPERSAGVYDTHNNRVALTIRSRGNHIALHDPEQVLADIAAKKAILDAYTTRADLASRGGLVHRDPLAFAVRTLASAYRHRPGWNTDWEQ